MKKFIVLGLLICPIPLMAMNKSMEYSKDNWDAEAYQNNNGPQREVALGFLQEAGDDFLQGKVIGDMGCGPGDITIEIAKIADMVYGFDISASMINKAKEISNVDNVEFLVSPAELLDMVNVFDSLTSFFCLHWVEDKQTVFTNFYNALKPGGKMLCTIATKEENPLVMGVAGKLFAQLKETYPDLQEKTMQELTGRFSIATIDLENMLSQCGFESIVIEPRIFEIVFASQEEFVEWQRPIFMSLPAIDLVPEQDVQDWFNKFIDALWPKLEKNNDGYTVYPLTTTRLTAQKPS